MNVPTVAGFDILGPLGSGGSAQVWRARRQFDNVAVALKVLRPEHGDLEAALAEAGLLAGVRHPHLVHLYDVLPLAGPQGRPEGVVMVTQLAAGGSLAQVLARRQLLAPGEVVTALHPMAMALADLHRAGIVHGDLSTGNILFRSDGMPLLADLGTARVVGEHGLRGLGTGGHDGMVAPEVVEGFPATAASDVYQMGALAWLCLLGSTPGPGYDRPAFAEVAPDLSPVVLDLVTKCMAPEPEDRPDADELGAALMDVAAPEPIEVAPDADPAHGVTQRLRQVALEDEAQAEPAKRAWWRPRRRGGRTRGGSIGEGSRGAQAPGMHRAQPARPSLLISGLVVVVSLALVAMVVTVLWPTPTPTSTPVSPAIPATPH